MYKEIYATYAATDIEQVERGNDYSDMPASRQASVSTSMHAGQTSARKIYDELSHSRPCEASINQAAIFLQQQLQSVMKNDAANPDGLPETPLLLEQWIADHTEAVGEQYRAYLERRKAGGARQYFPTKSHALHFLKAVAPTKLVDGAWLYGVLPHWSDNRFMSLVKIYLEELGDGAPDKNHVALFSKLLAAHDCQNWRHLSDEHFVQGAIQLALAYNAGEFLPEVIGFNLGYEQLPLHLLITAYELNELNIDPYYFTLHVTVDNAGTGHAHGAMQAVLALMPQADDGGDFYRRVLNGYALNDLGLSTTGIIDGFNLEEEVVAIFVEKATVGKMMHSDYCRIGGRTVNDWLSDPVQIPVFLQKMEEGGWIRRHRPPQESRFWALLEGDKAEMFGVFSAYEKQVIFDWITGDYADAADSASDARGGAEALVKTSRPLTYRARQRLLKNMSGTGRPVTAASPASTTSGKTTSLAVATMGAPAIAVGVEDVNHEVEHFQQHIAALAGKDQVMAYLIDKMGPATHATPIGMLATRLFSQMWMS